MSSKQDWVYDDMVELAQMFSELEEALADYEQAIETCPECGYLYDKADPRTGIVHGHTVCPACNYSATLAEFGKGLMDLARMIPRKEAGGYA